MGDRQCCKRRIGQKFFQPENAIDIEMIGRLIEQEKIGFANQFASQGHTLFPSAGHPINHCFGVFERKLRHALMGLRDGAPIVWIFCAFHHRFKNGRAWFKGRDLLEKSNTESSLKRNRSLIRAGL